DVVEFLYPPVGRPAAKEQASTDKPNWFLHMLAMLLDPRSIHWMLTLGGGLMVLGLIIWLVSLGIFEDPRIVALALSVGSIAVHVGGCWVTLKTRFNTAGRALTFLGCIVVPLNLWYFHAQGLVTLEGQLWLGGLLCCVLYAVTVLTLRDPLFMFAVEAGVTLTVLLLMANMGVISDATYLSLALMALALVSIHAERSFAPDADPFSRSRFGLPLFWSGHAQLGVSLLILLSAQAVDWLLEPAGNLLGIRWTGTGLTESYLLAGGLWLAGAYAYVYSDLVVRRVGVYIYLAAVCILMSELTIVGITLRPEGLIAVLAVTGMAVNLVRNVVAGKDEKLTRTLPTIALLLSALPILLGILLHARATSPWLAELKWAQDTDWTFVGAMLVVAVCSRVSAHIHRQSAPRDAARYLFFSAAGVIVGAAGLLRVLGLTVWSQQAPLLMLIPIAYIIASRLCRGQNLERPLQWVSHTASAVILLHVVCGSFRTGEQMLEPVKGETTNLLLGLVFIEATVFYVLAAVFRRRGANVYFATVAACGAAWQLMGYFGLPDAYHTILYATLGIVLLIVARSLGIEQTTVYGSSGHDYKLLRGRGSSCFHSGNGVLSMAFLAAFLQGLTRLATDRNDWLGLGALTLTTLVGMSAMWIVPPGGWRRVYATWSVALAGIAFISLQVLIDLTAWQKLEIFCVVAGIGILIASYIGHFRETDGQPSETVSLGVWLGSAMAALSLFIAVIYHRFFGDAPSLPDEFALLAVTVLMLVTGYSMQIKAPTLIGGTTLVVYLAILVVSLAYMPQVAVGVYLAVGGALLFGIGIALSMYRERLLELPGKIAKREGVFRVIGWR
ncbi:MAG: hypothetical protein ABI614_00860, partial [Planctomycetota bacterium]